MNLGLRWDVYPPWIEVDDRQSNFDETNGTFVLASDDATMGGVRVGRRLQTYSKGDVGPRLGFAYDLDGSGKTIVRAASACSGTSRRVAPPRRRHRTRLSSRRLALTPTPVSSTGVTLRVQDGLPPPTGVDPSRPPSGNTRSIFDVNFRDGYAQNYNLNVQRALGSNYLVEVAYAGSRSRHMVLKVDINQAPPVVGVSDANVNRPVHHARARPAVSQPVAVGRHHRLQRAAPEIPAAVREQLLVPEQLHAGQVGRLGVRQRSGDQQRLRSGLQQRAVGL